MRLIALIIGSFVTFKSGPITIGGFLSLSDVACIISIALLSAYFLLRASTLKKMQALPISWSVAIPFFVVLLCAWGYAMRSNLSGPDLTTFITMTLIFLSTYTVTQNFYFLPAEKDKDSFIAYYFYGVLLGLILPYMANKLGVVGSDAVYFYPGGRYKGFMSHQNQIGILSTFCFAFFLFKKNNIHIKIINLIACCIPLMLCTSKFNFALCFILTIIYVVYVYSPFLKAVNVALIGVIFGVVYMYSNDIIQAGIYILSVVNPDGAERLASFAASPEDSDATTSRTYLWEQAWTVGNANIPFGIGPAAAPQHLMYLSHAHNAVLNYYLIYGIPGVVYVLSVFFTIINLVWRSEKNLEARAAAAAALCAFIASNVSDSLSNSTALPILTSVALAFASMRRQKRFRSGRHLRHELHYFRQGAQKREQEIRRRGSSKFREIRLA